MNLDFGYVKNLESGRNILTKRCSNITPNQELARMLASDSLLNSTCTESINLCFNQIRFPIVRFLGLSVIPIIKKGIKRMPSITIADPGIYAPSN